MINLRYQQIKKRINTATVLSSRSPGDVKLLAVSKGQALEKLQALSALGQKDFAENYLQEAEGKIKFCDPAIEWHFIGPIQSNKTKKIAELFQWVHSVDRFSIAERLNRHCEALNKRLNICLQVNVSQEGSKSGVCGESIEELISQVNDLACLRCRGLMAIPAKDEVDVAFLKMAQLYKKLSTLGYKLDTLSMGMSNDFESAITAGSTMVRVGAALFGARS